jgi:hypothetical protein
MTYTEAFEWLIANKDVANAVAAVASAVMAAVAVFLSFVSLFVSHAALKHQRKHNQLTVRPLAYVTFGDYEDQLFVKVRNNGTGPMIVKSIKIVGAPNPSLPLIVAMPELLPNVNWTNFVEDCAGRSVPPGDELVLLDLSSESSLSNEHFEVSRDKVREALGKLQVLVTYTDIYGTSLPSAKRSLDFFHRTLTHLHA